MTEKECARFIDLADRLALEEAVDERDLRFLEKHAKSCPACRAEWSVWSGLSTCLKEGGAERSNAIESGRPSRAPLLRFRPFVLAAGILGALGVLGLFLAGPLPFGLSGGETRSFVSSRIRKGDLPPSTAVSSGQPSIEVISASGEVSAEGIDPVAGARSSRVKALRTKKGRLCVGLGNGGGQRRVCLSDDSEVAFESVESAAGESLALSLVRGEVTCTESAGDAKWPVSVRTRFGTARGFGARFVVGYASEDQAMLKVESGELVVELLDGTTRRVSGPEEFAFGPGVRFDAPDDRSSSESASAVLGPAQLLARAQTLRNSGKYSRAAQTYQELIRRYPASGEAGPTYLSLAELQLTQLGAPELALSSFRSYARRGGALTQEATYGEIRALRALGRDAEARVSAQKFVARYPNSGQAVSLKKWLSAPAEK